jgi:hypothetical protein
LFSWYTVTGALYLTVGVHNLFFLVAILFLFILAIIGHCCPMKFLHEGLKIFLRF